MPCSPWGLHARVFLGAAGGGTGASVRQAENQVRAAQADLLATEQTVLLDAVDAYSTAWQNGSVLNLALNNEQRLRRQLEATRDRFRVGEVARTDGAYYFVNLQLAGRCITTVADRTAVVRAGEFVVVDTAHFAAHGDISGFGELLEQFSRRGGLDPEPS